MIHCNVATCVGCNMCEVACSSFHFGAVSPAMSRIRVSKLEEIGIDVAVACLSCMEKYCMVCPTDALTAGDNGVIQLDADLCDACELCVDACPIGAVGFYDELPLFCNLCEGETVCVTVCPNGSLVNRDGLLQGQKGYVVRTHQLSGSDLNGVLPKSKSLDFARDDSF